MSVIVSSNCMVFILKNEQNLNQRYLRLCKILRLLTACSLGFGYIWFQAFFSVGRSLYIYQRQNV